MVTPVNTTPATTTITNTWHLTCDSSAKFTICRNGNDAREHTTTWHCRGWSGKNYRVEEVVGRWRCTFQRCCALPRGGRNTDSLTRGTLSTVPKNSLANLMAWTCAGVAWSATGELRDGLNLGICIVHPAAQPDSTIITTSPLPISTTLKLCPAPNRCPPQLAMHCTKFTFSYAPDFQ
jgi:hypothetical protein